MKILLILLLSLFVNACSIKHPIYLYQDLPVYELAKAIDDENLETIEEILEKEPNILKYKVENTIGVLKMAILNDRYKSCKKILDLGISPDFELKDGCSWFSFACGVKDSKYLKLFMRYNPDINYEARLVKGGTRYYTPLMSAIYHSMQNFKILLNAGADYNKGIDRFGGDWTPLASALLEEDIHIAHYLLLELGAKFKEAVQRVQSSTYPNGKYIYIIDYLRFLEFPLVSEEHKLKMECVEYMKKHGVDYFKTPIPDHIQRKYKNDPEYLEKY